MQGQSTTTSTINSAFTRAAQSARCHKLKISIDFYLIGSESNENWHSNIKSILMLFVKGQIHVINKLINMK